jgi:uncharacterized NAD(P)/FAD-binding protein YdhS
MSRSHAECYDIAIVGSGIACSMTILELARLLLDMPPGSRKLQIAIIEKEGEFWNGIAYGARSSINSLVITKLREFVKEPEKTSFIEWLEINKRRWLDHFEKNGAPTAAKWIRNNQGLIKDGQWDEIYLPRFVYGFYYSEKVTAAVNALKQKGLVTITLIQAEAIDIVPADDALYTITVEDAGGAQSFLNAERVVLAIGSPPLKPVPCKSHDRQPRHAYINDVYLPSEEVNLKHIHKALSAIHEKKKRNILVLGSNASSLETLYLVNHNPEIKALANSIVVISRSGVLPYKIRDQAISFTFKELELLKQKGPASAIELIAAIKADVQSAEDAALNIADLFHPISAVVGQVIPRMNVAEQKEFFCQHGMTFTKLMRRAGHEYREAADELAASGLLTVVKGEFSHLAASAEGDAFVSATYENVKTGETITHPLPFAIVVNCGGFEELQISSSRLISNVVKKNVCKVNSTNRGFLVNDQLEANRNLYIISPLMGGNFNDKIRFWHAESAPRIYGLSKPLANCLFDSVSRRVPTEFSTTP